MYGSICPKKKTASKRGRWGWGWRFCWPFHTHRQSDHHSPTQWGGGWSHYAALESIRWFVPHNWQQLPWFTLTRLYFCTTWFWGKLIESTLRCNSYRSLNRPCWESAKWPSIDRPEEQWRHCPASTITNKWYCKISRYRIFTLVSYHQYVLVLREYDISRVCRPFHSI